MESKTYCIVLGLCCLTVAVIMAILQNELAVSLGIPFWILGYINILCVSFGMMTMVFIIMLVRAYKGYNSATVIGN